MLGSGSQRREFQDHCEMCSTVIKIKSSKKVKAKPFGTSRQEVDVDGIA